MLSTVYIYIYIYCFFEYTVPIATSFLLKLIYAGLSLCLPRSKRRAGASRGERGGGALRLEWANSNLILNTIGLDLLLE